MWAKITKRKILKCVSTCVKRACHVRINGKSPTEEQINSPPQDYADLKIRIQGTRGGTKDDPLWESDSWQTWNKWQRNNEGTNSSSSSSWNPKTSNNASSSTNNSSTVTSQDHNKKHGSLIQLKTWFADKGMNTAHVHTHANFILRKFTKAVITEAFASAEPQKVLYDHAKKHWIELLPDKFMPLDNSVSKITIENSVEHLEVPPNIWKAEDSSQYIPIITKQSVASNATCSTIMNLEAAQVFLKQQQHMSASPLAIIVPTEETNTSMSNLVVESQKVALIHGPSKQTLVFPCLIIQLGQVKAVRDIDNTQEIKAIPSQAVVFVKWHNKDDHEWEDKCQHPVRHLMQNEKIKAATISVLSKKRHLGQVRNSNHCFASFFLC